MKLFPPSYITKKEWINQENPCFFVLDPYICLATHRWQMERRCCAEGQPKREKGSVKACLKRLCKEICHTERSWFAKGKGRGKEKRENTDRFRIEFFTKIDGKIAYFGTHLLKLELVWKADIDCKISNIDVKQENIVGKYAKKRWIKTARKRIARAENPRAHPIFDVIIAYFDNTSGGHILKLMLK